MKQLSFRNRICAWQSWDKKERRSPLLNFFALFLFLILANDGSSVKPHPLSLRGFVPLSFGFVLLFPHGSLFPLYAPQLLLPRGLFPSLRMRRLRQKLFIVKQPAFR